MQLLNILDCDNVNPQNIIFKQLGDKMMYPMYKSDKDVPLVIKTKYFTLKKRPIFKNDVHGNFTVYKIDPLDLGTEELFNTFELLDRYSEENKKTILKDHSEDSLNKISYHNCVRDSHIRFRLASNSKILDNPGYRIYFSGTDQSATYSWSELCRFMSAGKHIRMVIYINKLWLSSHKYGWGMRIHQIDVDDILEKKVSIVKLLKNNNNNFFSSKKDKYDDYFQKKKRYENQNNNKIVDIIKGGRTVPNGTVLNGAKNIFNEYYIPIKPSITV